MKHTPGPWEFHYDDKLDMISIGTSSQQEEAHDKSICGIWNVVNHGERSIDESFANARIIHAAPDLLEACEMALDNLQNGEGSTKYRLITVLEHLHAAIKKATK